LIKQLEKEINDVINFKLRIADNLCQNGGDQRERRFYFELYADIDDLRDAINDIFRKYKREGQ